MTPDKLWNRYSAIWSSDGETRLKELSVCLAPQATYCDPNGLIDSTAGLSDYMGQFQKSAPGARFEIQSVLHHHDRTLANWKLVGADRNVLQIGTSFGLLDEEHRLLTISGFFYSGMDRDQA